MLEQRDALRTWALSEPLGARATFAAEALPDHRKVYLEYEGPLTENRGSVSRWDQGTFRWILRSSELVVVQLAGKKWRGTARLQKSDSTSQRWAVAVEPEVSDSR